MKLHSVSDSVSESTAIDHSRSSEKQRERTENSISNLQFFASCQTPEDYETQAMPSEANQTREHQHEQGRQSYLGWHCSF